MTDIRSLTRSLAPFRRARPAPGRGLALAIVAGLVATTSVAAAGPTLVKDINPAGDSNPGWFTPVGQTVLFAAGDAKGVELWKSNGTTSGTKRVKDIRPGVVGSDVTMIVGMGSFVLFVADDGQHGRELWRSDGTAAGTKLVKDIDPSGHAFTGLLPVLTRVGSRVWFAADDGTSGVEPWVSDGTAAGTKRVQDIDPGAGSSNPGEFTQVGAGVVYSASAGGDRELWRSPAGGGTAARLKDINGAGSSTPSNLLGVGSVVYFEATTPSTGFELWKTNGTAGGTQLVKDINPGIDESLPTSFASVGGVVTFSAYDGTVSGLFVTDGTASGTKVAKDIAPGGNATINGAGVIDGSRIMGAGELNDQELWRTKGTLATTRKIKEIDPGGDADPTWITTLGSHVVFAADDGVAGVELWRSDGTATGTKRVADIRAGAAGSVPSFLVAANGAIWFSADDGSHGRELWRYVP